MRRAGRASARPPSPEVLPPSSEPIEPSRRTRSLVVRTGMTRTRRPRRCSTTRCGTRSRAPTATSPRPSAPRRATTPTSRSSPRSPTTPTTGMARPGHARRAGRHGGAVPGRDAGAARRAGRAWGAAPRPPDGAGRARAGRRSPTSAPLGPADVGEMLALVELTRPGPFAVRTVELGGYVGVFDDGALVAMAGERLRAPGLPRDQRGVHPPRPPRPRPRRRSHRARWRVGSSSGASGRSCTTRPTTTRPGASTRRSASSSGARSLDLRRRSAAPCTVPPMRRISSRVASPSVGVEVGRRRLDRGLRRGRVADHRTEAGRAQALGRRRAGWCRPARRRGRGRTPCRCRTSRTAAARSRARWSRCRGTGACRYRPGSACR